MDIRKGFCQIRKLMRPTLCYCSPCFVVGSSSHCCWSLCIIGCCSLCIVTCYLLCIIIRRYLHGLLFIAHLHCYYLVFAHVVIICYTPCVVVACFSPLLLFALCCFYLPFVATHLELSLLALCCLVLLLLTLVAIASFYCCIMPKHGKYDYTHD